MGHRTGPLAPTITWITDEANLSMHISIKVSYELTLVTYGRVCNIPPFHLAWARHQDSQFTRGIHVERFASSVIQVMVGASASDPVRGPHPMRASGRPVKDDSSPVRGPHPIRASEQEKEIQGGMGKEELKNEAPRLVAGVRKRVILGVRL